MPPGTTECNHSYFTGNPLSAPHSAQQLQNGTIATPAQPLASILCPAQCYHAVQSAHKSLRVPPVMAQVMSCRSLKRSRSSHSLSSYSVAESRLLLPSRLSHQCPSHSWMLLCRRLHLVTSLRMCPRRRLISRSPRYLLTWQCRRFSTVSVPHPWAAVQTIPHSTPSLNVSTQIGSRSASSFSVDVFVQTPVRRAVLHDAATQVPLTEFFIG